MREDHIGIIGLGYVGLPLAVEFGKKFKTLGFDVNSSRIDELESGIDITLETESSDIESAKKLSFSSDTNALEDPNIYIVTVPTPIDDLTVPALKLPASVIPICNGQSSISASFFLSAAILRSS